MNLRSYRCQNLVKTQSLEQGFSLIETVIALTTLGICLAYAMPLFLYAKVNNSKSEIRTGALIVSQRVFDNIRSKPLASAPINDGKNSASTGINPVLQPVNIATPTEAEKLLTKALGRQYQTKVTYCENYSTTDTDACGAKYRKFKVEVSYNGTKVYDLEGTYTELE
jgi:prepilin-type N-terminal cleavage/methylation domain-containing protein